MGRFAKPLYELKLVPGVRIPPSPPDSPNCIQLRELVSSGNNYFCVMSVRESFAVCTVVAHIVSKFFIAFAAVALTPFEQTTIPVLTLPGHKP